MLHVVISSTIIVATFYAVVFLVRVLFNAEVEIEVHIDVYVDKIVVACASISRILIGGGFFIPFTLRLFKEESLLLKCFIKDGFITSLLATALLGSSSFLHQIASWR